MIEKTGMTPVNISGLASKAGGSEIGASAMSDKFASFLTDAMQKLTDQQVTVEKLNNLFVKGELSDVHQLTIASEKAALGLELTVQVRNKAIEAYQEIMRTQL